MFKNLQDLFPGFNLFPRMDEEKPEAKELALEAEGYVRHLNGLTATDIDRGELISILKSTCLLLQRLVQREELSQTASDNNIVTSPSTESGSIPVKSEPELSNTLKELITLRDWVFLAKNNHPEANSAILSAIYQKIGQILAGENVIEIAETGYFNCERQQVIATQITNDPEKDDCVCHTVRPGYLFHGALIRPQEAIFYTFQPANCEY